MDGAIYGWHLVTSSMCDKGEIEVAQNFVFWS
jgi:hypothetical protein